MNITIKPLMPELAADYFDFFENRAFTDDSPYRCYCQVYQMSKEQYQTVYDNAKENPGPVSREVAERQIADGVLRGYLAYADGKSIGWCNANDRANYPAEPYCDVPFYAPAEKREKAVICFEVAPEYRGKGIATALLQQVLYDAKTEGYNAVVGFPILRDERYEWDCSSPIRLYEKAGFSKVSEKDGRMIMRKELEQSIENHILEALTGDTQIKALDFVSFFRANDMQFERSTTDYWADKLYWYVKFKGEFVGFILINGYGLVGDETEPEGWIFWSDNYNSDLFASFPLDERTKETAYKHVDFGTCGGGITVKLFGKEFSPVCNGTTFRFNNPDAAAVEFLKKLIEIRNSDIEIAIINTLEGGEFSG